MKDRILRKGLVFAIIVLFFGLALTPATYCKPTIILLDKETMVANSMTEFEKDNFYEYGEKIGETYHQMLRLLSYTYYISLRDYFREKIMKQAEKQIKILENNYPDLFVELKGLAAGSNINIEILMALQIYIHSIFIGKCTVTLSTGPATVNNQTFLTQNFDIKPFNILTPMTRLFFTRKCKLHKLSSTYGYVYFGIPILYEIPLLNEKGLGYGGNALSLTTDPNRNIDEGPGIPTYLLVRITMMTCSNVSEVAYLWKNSNRSSDRNKKWPHHWDFSTEIWCDREGGLLMIEQTHSYIITVFSNSTDISNSSEGILWHANHHQWLDPELTGSKYPDEHPNSDSRAKRARELLELNYGKITLDVCKSICRDHGGGTNKNGKDSSDICRHADGNNSYQTSFSWIIQPKKYTVYWTRGQPCSPIRGKFKMYNFTEKLTR